MYGSHIDELKIQSLKDINQSLNEATSAEEISTLRVERIEMLMALGYSKDILRESYTIEGELLQKDRVRLARLRISNDALVSDDSYRLSEDFWVLWNDGKEGKRQAAKCIGSITSLKSIPCLRSLLSETKRSKDLAFLSAFLDSKLMALLAQKNLIKLIEHKDSW